MRYTIKKLHDQNNMITLLLYINYANTSRHNKTNYEFIKA